MTWKDLPSSDRISGPQAIAGNPLGKALYTWEEFEVGDENRFTIDDAVDLFGTAPEPEPEVDDIKLSILSKPKSGSEDQVNADIREKALHILGVHTRIYKLTLQGMLEAEFPLVNKQTIRKAVNSLKDHPQVSWPHQLLLEKV